MQSPHENVEKGSGQKPLLHVSPVHVHTVWCTCSSKRSHDTIIMPRMLITPKCMRSQRATMDVESALTVATARLWYIHEDEEKAK